MASDDEVIPPQVRIEAVGDDTDLRALYDTDCRQLHVSCARARDHLPGGPGRVAGDRQSEGVTQCSWPLERSFDPALCATRCTRVTLERRQSCAGLVDQGFRCACVVGI